MELEQRKYVLFYEVDGDAAAGGDVMGAAEIPVPQDLGVRITPTAGGSEGAPPRPLWLGFHRRESSVLPTQAAQPRPPNSADWT
jgi:hypothetical protein